MGQKPLSAQPCRRRALVRVSLTICALLLGVIVLAGAAPAGGSDSGLGDSSELVVATSVVHMRPVDADGRLMDGFRVTKSKRHASCVGGIVGEPPAGMPSGAVPGALECIIDLTIWGPCWPESGRSRPSVICLSFPWDHDVLRLFTSEAVPPVSSEPQAIVESGFPWGVEIENGLRCYLSEGASGFVENESISYYCGDLDELGLVLIGAIDRNEALWTVRAARYFDGDANRAARRVDDKAIVTAWFGAAPGVVLPEDAPTP